VGLSRISHLRQTSLFYHVLQQKYHNHFHHKEHLHFPEHPVATAALRDVIKGTHVVSTANSVFSCASEGSVQALLFENCLALAQAVS
jgi:hypothetical protein